MAKTIFAALFGLTAGLLSGCGEGTAADSITNEGRITIALQEVLRRNDEPFAIIEHAPSGNFVQFIGSIHDPLLLDLPIQALTAEEKTRAEKLIAELGGAHTDSGFTSKQAAMRKKPRDWPSASFVRCTSCQRMRNSL